MNSNDGLPAVSPETRAMLARLIAFDTTSRNPNLELIHHVRDYLQRLGVASELTHNAEGNKANLYATLGPDDRPGIALSGHSDVVPVDGQDWSSDPFTLEERAGRLYGRGTCDMKGFIATALAFAPKFLAAELKTPIHLCFSFDEEVGCRGVPHLLRSLAEKAVRPAMCIVGEPTSMKVVTAHKGKLSMVCQVRGKEAHSSLAPQAVNAINAAARVITRLEARTPCATSRALRPSGSTTTSTERTRLAPTRGARQELQGQRLSRSLAPTTTCARLIACRGETQLP